MTARCALPPAPTAGFRLAAAGCTEPPVRYTMLADAVVASARGKGALPFKLACRPFPAGSARTSRCADDVRKILAEADSRAIVQVTDCHEGPKPPSLAVHIGKRPGERGPTAEDRWTLYVRYRDQDKLSIARVEVSDTVIDFE